MFKHQGYTKHNARVDAWIEHAISGIVGSCVVKKSVMGSELLVQSGPQLFQQVCEVFLLSIRKNGGSLGNKQCVFGKNILEQGTPFFRQMNDDGPSVLFATLPSHQTFPLQIVDDTGHVSTADKHFLRQVADGHRPEMPQAFYGTELRLCQSVVTDISYCGFVEHRIRSGEFHPHTERSVRSPAVFFRRFHDASNS